MDFENLPDNSEIVTIPIMIGSCSYVHCFINETVLCFCAHDARDVIDTNFFLFRTKTGENVLKLLTTSLAPNSG